MSVIYSGEVIPPGAMMFVFSHPRSAANIVSFICRHLEAGGDCYILLLGDCYTQIKEGDLNGSQTEDLIARFEDTNVVFFPIDLVPYREAYDFSSAGLYKHLSSITFDVALVDNSLSKIKLGLPQFYYMCRRLGVPVVSMQEGLLDRSFDLLPRIAENLGYSYDYTFVLGNYDKMVLLENNSNISGRVFATGIPYEGYFFDGADEDIQNDYILVILSYLSTSKDSDRFSPIDILRLLDNGLLEFAIKKGLSIVFKVKNDIDQDVIESVLGKYDKVFFEFGTSKNQYLIDNSSYVVSAGGTLSLYAIKKEKPIILIGKPFSAVISSLSCVFRVQDSTKHICYEKEFNLSIRSYSEISVDDKKFISMALVCGSELGYSYLVKIACEGKSVPQYAFITLTDYIRIRMSLFYRLMHGAYFSFKMLLKRF